MEPYTSRHAGVVWAIRAITTLESIRSKRAKQSSGGVDLSSHIGEGWLPRSQSSGVLTLRCRYLSHPRERSESIGYSLTVFIKLPLWLIFSGFKNMGLFCFLLFHRCSAVTSPSGV